MRYRFVIPADIWLAFLEDEYGDSPPAEGLSVIDGDYAVVPPGHWVPDDPGGLVDSAVTILVRAAFVRGLQRKTFNPFRWRIRIEKNVDGRWKPLTTV